MKSVYRLFFQLLEVSLGNRIELSRVPSAQEWQYLNKIAAKQSLLGICFQGILRLPEEQKPDKMLYLRWLGQAEFIRTRNEQTNIVLDTVVKEMQEKGYETLVLKGQGIAQLYPDAGLRSSGDIDLFLPGISYSQVYEILRFRDIDKTEVDYHHVGLGSIMPPDSSFKTGVEIELHYRPSWFFCPWYNRRLQNFLSTSLRESGIEILNVVQQNKQTQEQTQIQIPVPSLAFNRVYILVHIYRHLFHDGIGLRQILDYYMLLQATAELENPESAKATSLAAIKSLGMYRFTAALMWILSEYFGLPEEALLCPPCKSDGRFLLSEVMQSGNFGHSDSRIKYDRTNRASRFFGRIKRMRQIFAFGLSEVLCSPFWKLWHSLYFIPMHYYRRN